MAQRARDRHATPRAIVDGNQPRQAPTSPAPAARAGRAAGRATRTAQAADLYQSIVELAPDATVVVDGDGCLRLVNRQTEVLFGYARTELLGQPVELLLPERFRGAHQQQRADYAAAPYTRPMGATRQLFGRRHDGSEFPVEVSLAPLPDAANPLVIATIREVSAVQRVQAANRELRCLQAVTDTALAHLELNELLAELVVRVREVLEATHVTILLLEPDTQTLAVRAESHQAEEAPAWAHVPVGVGFAGRVAASREPLLVPDLSRFPLVRPQLRATLRTAAGVPLLARDRVLGVLCVGAARAHHFAESDVALLERVAERITTAVERAQLFAAEQQARQEAERERARWQAAMESTPEYVITCDADLRMTYVNPAYARVRGGPADLAVPVEERPGRYGLFLADGVHHFPVEQLPLTRAVREGWPVQGVEMLVRTAQGEERLVEWEAAPMYSAAGVVLGAVAIGQDITERRQLERVREQALSASEVWFRTLADTAPALVWVTDPEGRVTFVNQPWLQFTGRSIEQEVGNGWAEAVHLDDVDRCLQTYRAAFAARERFTMEYRLRRSDGEYRWMVDTGVPRFALDGTFVGYIGSAMDISERHRLEQEREEARANELAVREVNRHLDEFFRAAAHDLRQPATVAKGQAEMATRRFERLAARLQVRGGHQAHQAADVLTTLRQTSASIDRLSRLSAELFDVARARTGTLELRLARVDLAAQVRAQVLAQRVATPARTLHLRLPYDGRPVWVQGDSIRLEQALTNYLTNALKYSAAEKPVEVHLEVAEQLAVVSVHDQGPGLPWDEQSRVWEMFHRVPGVDIQSGAEGSLGIGLYIVKQLVELHPGGRVGVESVEGEGSIFWFRLPLVVDYAPDEAAP